MEYFFVKPDKVLDVDNNEVYKISLDDINHISLFATTLEPLPEVTEFNGYTLALNDYYSKNIDDYSESYHNLVSSSFGKEFLSNSIQLALLEKQFRENGLSENGLKAYEKCIQDYQSQLDYNQSMFMDMKKEDNKQAKL